MLKKAKSSKGKKKDAGASQHASMLAERDAEKQFMQKLERQEAAFKHKQLLGAVEFQRLYRGFIGRCEFRMVSRQRFQQAVLAQRLCRGYFGRADAAQTRAWLDECARQALHRFDPFKAEVPRAKAVVLMLHGPNNTGAGLHEQLRRSATWAAFEQQIVRAGVRPIFPDAVLGRGEAAKRGIRGDWIEPLYFTLRAPAAAYRPWRRKFDVKEVSVAKVSALDKMLAARGKSEEQLAAEAKAEADAARGNPEELAAREAGGLLLKQQERLEEMIVKLMDEEELPPHRIVIGGVGAGATVALTAALRSEFALRAVFMLGGMLHPQADLFDGPLCRAMPSLLLLHGEQDTVMPPAAHKLTCSMLARTTVNADPYGLADVTTGVCTGCGHELFLGRSEASEPREVSEQKGGEEEDERVDQEEVRLKRLIRWFYQVLSRPLKLTPELPETLDRSNAPLYTRPSLTYTKFFSETKPGPCTADDEAQDLIE